MRIPPDTGEQEGFGYDMEILIPVLLVAAIGLIAGAGLSIASVVMAVKTDEKAEVIRECLPGANCRACGYSGCDGYAAALSNGEEKQTGLCAPGGPDAAKAIAEVLGVEAGDVARKTALVHCHGTCEKTSDKMEYHGVGSCLAATQLFGGKGQCSYGCIGFGDCVKVCEFDAVRVCDGVAVVNPGRCAACAKCVEACPKHLISLVPAQKGAVVRCSSHEKGAKVRKDCAAGCIGCMKCVKACAFDAIHVENFLAAVDAEKCTACGKCAGECPQSCIVMM